MLKPGKVIELTNSQTKFINCDKKAKAVAFVAGMGSGKTFSLVLKMITVKLQFPQADVLYLCPIFSMMRDILIPMLDEILLPTNIIYKVNKTTGEVVFDKGGRVIVKSMDDPSKIIGMNVFAVFMDELDTLPKNKAKEIWLRGIQRARKSVPILKDGKEQYDENNNVICEVNQLFVSTTPEGYKFVYDRFKKNKPKNYTLIQASTYENKHLPTDFIEAQREIYSDELFNAYVNGQFVNLTSGTVYSSYDRLKCNSQELVIPNEELFIGIDFNVGGMNGIVYVKRNTLQDQGHNIPMYRYNNKQTLHAVYHFKSTKSQPINDTPQLISAIQSRFQSGSNYHKIYCFPDSSGKNTSSKGATVSDISLLKEAGFKCKYPSKNPPIINRVLSANSAFKTGLVRINADQCPDLANALEQQIYDERTELPEKESGPSIDDITDAATYIINFLFPIKRKTTSYKELKGV